MSRTTEALPEVGVVIWQRPAAGLGVCPAPGCGRYWSLTPDGAGVNCKEHGVQAVRHG